MPTILRHEVVKRLFATAIASGGERVSLARVRWNIAGDCLKPVHRLIYGRPDGKAFVYQGKKGPLMVELTAKCRQCENCLKKRGAHWSLRARAECAVAEAKGCRTWLVTLTLSPENHFKCLTRARRHLDAQGIDFDRLSGEDQFEMRHREAGREVTLFLKRLRKGGAGHDPAKFRYLMVAEAHKSGLPHYHLLVHEIDPMAPVRHAAIKRAWVSGFSDAKLVTEPSAATYATKYLTKSALARVRASVAYGKTL